MPKCLIFTKGNLILANVGNVECCRLVKKHPTMIPGKSWGDMARWVHGADRQYWQDHGCDAKVGGSSKSKCPRWYDIIVQFIINQSKTI